MEQRCMYVCMHVCVGMSMSNCQIFDTRATLQCPHAQEETRPLLYFVGALTVVVAAMAVVLIWLVRKQTTSPPVATAAPSETSQRCVRLNVHTKRPKTCKFPRILQILSSSRYFVAHFAKRECEQHMKDAGGIRSY